MRSIVNISPGYISDKKRAEIVNAISEKLKPIILSAFTNVPLFIETLELRAREALREAEVPLKELPRDQQIKDFLLISAKTITKDKRTFYIQA